MNNASKRKILKIYFISSLAVICLSAFLAFGPFYHRDILDTSQQSLPMTWNEHIGNYLAGLLVPALYGLFSGLLIRKVGKKEKVGNRYFIWALVIGILSLFLSWIAHGLQHIDCADSCVPYIPTYTEIYVIIALSLPLLVVAPAMCAYYFRRSST